MHQENIGEACRLIRKVVRACAETTKRFEKIELRIGDADLKAARKETALAGMNLDDVQTAVDEAQAAIDAVEEIDTSPEFETAEEAAAAQGNPVG